MKNNLCELEQLVDEKIEFIRDKRNKEKVKVKEWAAEKEKFWKEEADKFDKKLEFSSEIFNWIEKFVNTDVYKKLQQIEKYNHRYAVNIINYGTWGHCMENPSGGKSQIVLRSDTTIMYLSNYKWLPWNEKIELKTPEEMANNLTLEYITDFKKKIDSGEILEKIKKKVESVDSRFFS